MYNKISVKNIIFYFKILTLFTFFSNIFIGTFKKPTRGIINGKVNSFKEREMKMNTFMAKKSDVKREWFVIDAEGKNLGRVASKAATILRGKHKAIYTPNVDCGDYVIIINADKVAVTGRKLDQKIYYHHSDYVGGMKETTLREKMNKKPEEVVEMAVKGMLPKGPLGRQMYKKLFVYAGSEHKHAAQKPEVLTF